MTYKKNYQCLLVKTKDQKKLFTDEKNLPELIEFSKSFGAEISVVQVKEAEILDITKLGTAICDSNYQPVQCPDYKIIKTPNISKQIKKETSPGQKIRKFIKDKFLNKKEVSLKGVIKKFDNHLFTPSCFCNHIKFVRNELEKEGYEIEKIGWGIYKIK